MYCEHYSDYYNEYDPAKRLELLDGLTCEEGSGDEPERMRALAACRYAKNRGGGTVDNFIGVILTFKTIAMQKYGAATRRNRKEIQKAVDTLCLTRVNEFGRDVLYREMCHLIAMYITSCMSDRQYGSMCLGFGRLKDDTIRTKVRKDLSLIRGLFPQYLDDREECRIILDAMDEVEAALL